MKGTIISGCQSKIWKEALEEKEKRRDEKEIIEKKTFLR